MGVKGSSKIHLLSQKHQNHEELQNKLEPIINDISAPRPGPTQQPIASIAGTPQTEQQTEWKTQQTSCLKTLRAHIHL